jgi:DNA-binding response OmpR family regulator
MNIPTQVFPMDPREITLSEERVINGQKSALESTTQTILVVDDDLDIRFFVQILMQISGYKVLTARDGIEALEQISLEMPDLILLDVSMGRLDGLEVLRLIRANEPSAQVPVVLISGHGSADDVTAGMRAGANHYVTKPFESGHLVFLVQKLLTT